MGKGSGQDSDAETKEGERREGKWMKKLQIMWRIKEE